VRLCAEELGIPVLTPHSFYAYAGEPEHDPLSGGDGVRSGGDSGAGTRGGPGGTGTGARTCDDSAHTPLFNARGTRVVDARLLARVAAVNPDFIVVAAYGMILPRQVLDLPRQSGQKVQDQKGELTARIKERIQKVFVFGVKFEAARAAVQ
jgi:hypothetical protein